MADQDDLRLAIQRAYADSPVPESLTAAAQALLDGEGLNAEASEDAVSGARVDRAPAPGASKRRAVIAATMIAAAVTAVVLVATNLTAPRSDRGASPRETSRATAASTLSTGTTVAPTSRNTQASTAGDLQLLRAMAIGVVIQPGAGPATDSSTVVDAINWSFTRSRTIPAPVAEVITWYQTNLRSPDTPQSPTLIDSTLQPWGRTPELAAAERLFVQPRITVRFTRTANDTTKVDVIASGFRRDVHPREELIPAAEIVSTELNWMTDGMIKSQTRSVDTADGIKLISYLNSAPLVPALTYSGTTGGKVFDITFTATDGSIYTAHWDSNIGGGAAGVTLDLPAAGSKLVDPEPGFYQLLGDLTTTQGTEEATTVFPPSTNTAPAGTSRNWRDHFQCGQPWTVPANIDPTLTVSADWSAFKGFGHPRLTPLTVRVTNNAGRDFKGGLDWSIALLKDNRVVSVIDDPQLSAQMVDLPAGSEDAYSLPLSGPFACAHVSKPQSLEQGSYTAVVIVEMNTDDGERLAISDRTQVQIP